MSFTVKKRFNPFRFVSRCAFSICNTYIVFLQNVSWSDENGHKNNSWFLDSYSVDNSIFSKPGMQWKFQITMSNISVSCYSPLSGSSPSVSGNSSKAIPGE